jgi:hypothetical protein
VIGPVLLGNGELLGIARKCDQGSAAP